MGGWVLLLTSDLGVSALISAQLQKHIKSDFAEFFTLYEQICEKKIYREISVLFMEGIHRLVKLMGCNEGTQQVPNIP